MANRVTNTNHWTIHSRSLITRLTKSTEAAESFDSLWLDSCVGIAASLHSLLLTVTGCEPPVWTDGKPCHTNHWTIHSTNQLRLPEASIASALAAV
jgi:hypothetical protein